MPPVAPVPAFQDNYQWLLHDAAAGTAAIVDPGDARTVEEALEQRGLTLRAVLLTHHHLDHIGGAVELARRWKAPVYGPDDARIAQRDVTLGDGDSMRLDEFDLDLQILAVPAHTSSHIAYFGNDALFCGDTMFAMGCGRLFEGTPAQMQSSLGRLAALPGSTRVFCGHEYTVANACFALEVEPTNAALRSRYERCKQMRRNGEPTLPSTIAEELATNPFLRCDQPEIRARLEDHVGHPLPSTVERFAALRAWKDGYAAPAEMLA